MENKQSIKHPLLAKVVFIYIVAAYLLAGLHIIFDHQLSLPATIGAAIIPTIVLFAYCFIVAKIIEKHGIVGSVKVALTFGTIFWIINAFYLL